jgi:FkbM family methyltransferase
MLIDFRTLFPKYRIKPKGVLHVGANVGEEAGVYLELGIKRQVWIEANPEIFLKLKNNISGNPEAVAYNFAAGDENKQVTLHIANNNSQSSSLLELGTHKQQHPDVHYIADVEVPMMRCDGFEFDGCDFLNMDVQGLELSVLKGIGSKINNFKWVYTEVNRADVYQGCAQIESIDLFMVSNGFRRVETKWVGNWGDALYIR